jgi:chlorobactene glucosyltransferase
MMLLLIFTTIALLVIAIQTLINVFVLPRLKPISPWGIADLPLVSVLIPARNEANVIAQTVQHMLAQNYPNFEVIILDDASSDNTGILALQTADGDARLCVINGAPLPHDWLGKNWACHQLAHHAQGDVLVFTDADTLWQPTALCALIKHMQHQQADLVTVWSTQQTLTWSERLIVPLMAFVILGYLPIIMTHYSPFAIFAAANGQCMAWRKRAYFQVGGHQSVADNVLEDVSLARLAKKHGLTLRMADSGGLIACRMYTDWHSVRDGYAKNILAGYGNSVIALILATIFHLLLFIMPFFWLFSPYSAWAIALIALDILARALSATFSRQRPQDALLMPLSVLLMTRIAVQALYWHYTGGVRWKGRTISQTTKETSWQKKPSSSVPGSAD